LYARSVRPPHDDTPMCTLEQRRLAYTEYRRFMKQAHYQGGAAALWVLIVSAVAIGAGATSVPALGAFALVALMPPIVMQRLWREPPQTTSEAIREARR